VVLPDVVAPRDAVDDADEALPRETLRGGCSCTAPMRAPRGSSLVVYVVLGALARWRKRRSPATALGPPR
jgi:MYXO-CTERM domain-containing protein